MGRRPAVLNALTASMLSVACGGADPADQLGLQAQPRAAGAAAGPGGPLARSRRDAESQVSARHARLFN